MSASRKWILEHDDRWAFLAPYLILSVVLSIFVSLFWLLVLILIHAALEWSRQRIVDSRPLPAILRVLWELKVDSILLLMALCVTLYTEAVLGLLGIGQAARVGAQSVARFAAWERGIRGFLLTVDEGLFAGRGILKAFRSRYGKTPSDEEASETERQPTKEELVYPWRSRWGMGTRFVLVVLTASALLLIFAPLILDLSVQESIRILLDEMHPWPSG